MHVIKISKHNSALTVVAIDDDDYNANDNKNTSQTHNTAVIQFILFTINRYSTV